MPALPSLETVGRGGLTPSAGMMIDEALFADPLLASDRRAVAFAPPGTSAQMLAATSRAGGWLVVYADVGSWGLATANDAAEPPRRSFGLDESRISVVLARAPAAPFRIAAAAEDGAAAAGQQAMAARGDVARKAVLAAVSTGNPTAFVVAAARGVPRRDACVIGVPHRWGSPLLSGTDATILFENSEEALQGGAAGAAQKAVLDMSSSKGGKLSEGRQC
jgi:N-acetylmuramic acid 6-phosphate (MurNAc-6-P) etherase